MLFPIFASECAIIPNNSLDWDRPPRRIRPRSSIPTWSEVIVESQNYCEPIKVKGNVDSGACCCKKWKNVTRIAATTCRSKNRQTDRQPPGRRWTWREMLKRKSAANARGGRLEVYLLRATAAANEYIGISPRHRGERSEPPSMYSTVRYPLPKLSKLMKTHYTFLTFMHVDFQKKVQNGQSIKICIISIVIGLGKI